MPEKIPIGTRVTGNVDMSNLGGTTEAVMKVVGYDGLKFVIVEVLEDVGHWKKGHVTTFPTKSLTRREEVKHIPGDPEDENGPAIGWMELNGLSVALTRDHNGVLLIAIEKGPDSDPNESVHVRISKQHGGEPDLWEGDVP